MPTVNRLLMISCCTLVAVFHDSSNLAAAYGVAVTSTMVITSILFYNHARRNWNWPIAVLVPLVAVFLTVDLAFFTANISKVFAGGWVPILIGITIFTVMTTWSRGREVLSRSMLEIATPLGDFLKKIEEIKPPRVKGTAVFMTLTRDIAPSVLLHHFKHSRVLHEKVILLSVITENRPEVSGYERVRVTDLELGFVKVIARYGYMESPDISEILDLCEGAGLTLDRSGLSFYLGRETFLTTGASGLASWRKKIFVFLSRNARPATDFFGIPPDRVIEIGSQIRI